MAAAIGIIVLGGILVASGLKGVSVADLIAGAVRGTLNPAGGRKEFADLGAILDNAPGMTGGGSATGGGPTLGTTTSDARALVEYLAQVGIAAGGGGTYIVSGYRPGDPLDHGGNDANKAARDIAVKGVDALKGPPMPELDRAVVAIGKALGRDYKPGTVIIDTFTTKGGLRVQVLWRTPLYGDHRGHIHVGARRK
jgi:hypothetical protein